ncbi:MAG: pyridoxamine 5'-phosphate oxidase family protein [Tepidiformaceae bacterium]
MPVELTQEMRDAFDNALKDGAPVLIASASATGMPDIAFKGSAMVWDKDHVAFWERARGTTMRNLEENGQACLLYRNIQTRVAWKFFGTAEVMQEGPLRDEIMARTTPIELDRDPDRKGAAVLIRIDRVVQGPNVLMQRDD